MSKTLGSKVSVIWNYFSKGNNMTLCNFCDMRFSNKSNSSNLKKHLLRKHPSVEIPKSGISVKQSMHSSSSVRIIRDVNPVESSPCKKMRLTSDSENPPTPVPGTSESATRTKLTYPGPASRKTMSNLVLEEVPTSAKQTIDNNLLNLFTLDFQPFSIVNDRGFRKFVNVLNPSYVLPTRKTITNTLLPAKYRKRLNELRVQFCDAHKPSVVLSTDWWTSIESESFIAVTCHFINTDFYLKSYLLESFSFPQSNSSSYVADELKRIAVEWGIDNKILLCVSDNASNIKSAIKEILKWEHFDCYAQTLNLIAHDVIELPKVTRVINKIKSLVHHIKLSPFSTEKLLEIQKQYGCPPKKLLTDISTRWHSTYYMLERFVDLETPVRRALALVDQEVQVLSENEWRLATQLVRCLRPLEEVTKIMSGENYVTASSIIVITKGMENVYHAMNDDGILLQETQEVIDIILTAIQNRLGNLENNSTFMVTTFLDPRFKMVGFSNSSVAESAKKTVINLIINKFEPVEPPKTKDDDRSEDRMPTIWDLFDRKAADFKPAGTFHSRATGEVERYLDEPLLNRGENPLDWWRENGHNYPLLKAIVLEKFASLATSVPCERLFSKNSLILSNRRSHLSSDKVNELVFLNTNQ